MADPFIQYDAHDTERSSGADERKAAREAVREEMRHPGADARQEASQTSLDRDNIATINGRVKALEDQVARVMVAHGEGLKVDWPAISIDLRALKGGGTDDFTGQTMDFEFGVSSGDFVLIRIPAQVIATL